MGRMLRKMTTACLAVALLAAGIISLAQPAQAATAKAWEKKDGKFYDSAGKEVEGVVAKGMDVSEWQSLINWDRVKESGQIDFAFIRVAHGNGMDKWYDRNLREANRVGIPVGVYFYSLAKTATQAKKDAATTINAIKEYKITYPVVIDVEDKTQLTLTNARRTKIVQTFADEVRAAGYQPMIYCNTDWASKYINMASLNGVDTWIAEWSRYTPSVSRDIWQVTDKGKVDGIGGAVDLDFAYKTYGASASSAGWIKSSKGYQYQLSNGDLVKSRFKTISGKKYYFDASGYRVTGFKTIDGKSYYFDKNGVMKTGWLTIEGAKYYFNARGVMAKAKWQKTNGKRYYLGKDGKMKTGWLTLNGKKYYLDAKGVMQTAWVQLDNAWYFFNNSKDLGVMLRNEWVQWKGSWYFLKKSGKMKTGWLNWNGNRYYLRQGGDMRVGWLKYKGKYYYFDKNGVMLRSTTRRIDGKKYQFDEKGVWVK